MNSMSVKLLLRFSLALALALPLGLPARSQGQERQSATTSLPESRVLTGGQWLLREDRLVFYVQIEVTADDKARAGQEGLVHAVEMAVGAMAATEALARHKESLRQDVRKDPSVYVENASIRSETTVGNKVRLVMDVWVGQSKIAARLRTLDDGENNLSGEGDIDGARVAEQQKSLKDRQDSGIPSLERVAKDFPRKAFDVKVGKIATRVDGEQVTISVPVEIAWNKTYMDSLIEALDKTKDGTESVTYNFKRHQSIIAYRKIGGWLTYFASYQSARPLEILSESFFYSSPQVRLNFRDQANALLAFNCREIAPLSGVFYGDAKMVIGLHPLEQPTGQFVAHGAPAAHIGIYGDYDVGGTLHTTVQGRTELLARMRKVDAEIVRRVDCEGDR